ncbi:TetR/AcrR family transcriptional regulator [Segnochrobactrum spirostomi]|uniref:TetR/AcrR family transcriptional regulator n=1 Tax=Segnochrobactrum spirostomi TaxID=2608987 RepID=UPI001297856D|nr:TetR/AcrR family transcriptional regulator [Segnochrobactrum spirostomi]
MTPPTSLATSAVSCRRPPSPDRAAIASGGRFHAVYRHRASPVDLDDGPSGRILAAARLIFADRLYSGLTMDGLAAALGMSKKTIYAHFPSKEALIGALVEATGRTIRRRVGEVLADPNRDFAGRLEGVLAIVSTYLGLLTPPLVDDLARHAPQIVAAIDALKARNIPLVIGEVLRGGVTAGLVRDDIDIPFAVEFWLETIKGLHTPASLARTERTPRAVFDEAFALFLAALLTDRGRATLGSGRTAAPSAP